MHSRFENSSLLHGFIAHLNLPVQSENYTGVPAIFYFDHFPRHITETFGPLSNDW